MIEAKPNLVADGVNRLVADFRTKKNMVRILESWLRAVKRLDDLAVAVLYAHLLESAAGVQLDHIGGILGEPRLGRQDEPYRAGLKGSARARASLGRTLDIFEILDLVLGPTKDFAYYEAFFNTFTVTVSGLANDAAESLARLLKKAKPAGTNGALLSSELGDFNLIDYGSVNYISVGGAGGYGSVHGASNQTYVHARDLSQ